MCLTIEFFDFRAEAREKYEKKGYIDITDLFEDERTSEIDLYIVGLIQEKEICSTADLDLWELTDDGKRYMKEFKDPQLVMIKPGKLNPLLWEIERKL